MVTKSLNISLPEELKDKATKLAIENNHGSIGRYIQHLLRQESEKYDERKRLETLLSEGRKSGISEIEPKAFFNDLRKKLR